MNTFLWTMLILGSLTVIGRLLWLVTGIPPRTPKSEAINLVGDIVVLVWIAVLLAR